MTSGQQWALEQLQDVEATSDGAFEVIDLSLSETGVLKVHVAISCRHMERREGGLPLRQRERFVFSIGPGFPFSIPTVRTRSTRFAGYPHVQWGRQLCLYLAPASEWDAGDGMLGFLQRLDEWLRQGALGELDPADAPLHPPVAYRSADSRVIIPRVNTPTVTADPWLGLASLAKVSDRRADIISWHSVGEQSLERPVAGAMLLPRPFDFFEFPRTVRDLVAALDRHGVDKKGLFVVLQLTVASNSEEDPILVILGAPLRGVPESGDLRQHLVVWEVDDLAVRSLRLSLSQYWDHEKLRKLGDRAEEIFWDWADDANVTWCSIREARPEVTVRRDHDTPLSWFAGKSVAIWGCGALGGHMAQSLARANVGKLVLWDRGSVSPGVIIRQPFEDRDIGENKAKALAKHLRRIRPGLEVEPHGGNVVFGALGTEDWSEGVDLVIDATAARTVSNKLESKIGPEGVVVPVASVVVGHRADKAMITLSLFGFSGGPAEVAREAKLQAQQRSTLAPYVEEFWPARGPGRGRLFQPEPGCSDLTFIGSAADISALAGIAIDMIGADLARTGEQQATVHFLSLPQRRTDPAPLHFSQTFETRHVYIDRVDGYPIRIAHDCWHHIIQCVERQNRRKDAGVETGGVLFGECDHASRVVWLDEATDPPVDSRASAEGFLCGTAGVQDRDTELRAQTGETIRFIGMWHTHPHGPPVLSSTDYHGISQILDDSGLQSQKALIIVLGNSATGTPNVGAFLFSSAHADQAVGTSLRFLGRPMYPFRYGSHIAVRTGRRSLERAGDVLRLLTRSIRAVLAARNATNP